MYWSVVWCSAGCSWKCYKILTFCSLLTRFTIPRTCHAERHLNVQKWSEPLVLLTFWLGNVLRATTVCTFSTSQLPKVVRAWCALYILTSKCASRHNGVQFFISHLARWLRTRRFSEPIFRPSGATNHWKNTVLRDFPTFSRICIFFLLTLSLLWSSLFYSPLLSDPFHLCFSSIHIVGSLTSKLPSLIYIYTHKDNYLSGYLLGKSEYGIYHGWYDFGILNIRPKNTRRCVTGPTVWFKHTKIWILLHGLCLNFQYLSDSSDSSDCELSASKKSKSSMATYNGWKKSCISWQVVVSQYLCFFKGLNYPR